MSKLKKAVRKVVSVVSKVNDLTHKKAVVLSKVQIPESPTSRVVVLGNYLKSLGMKKGVKRVIDLTQLNIRKVSFESLISSRACIGTTTRKGLSGYSFKCIDCVKSPTLNKKLYVKFEVTKV